MENILEIELFGEKHKIKTDDDLSHARLTADYLVSEVVRIEQAVAENPSGLNQFVKLLLAALNISNEYIKLRHGHRELDKSASDKYLDIVKRIATDLADSEQLPSGFLSVADGGFAPPVPEFDGAGAVGASSGSPEPNGEGDTESFGLDGEQMDRAVPVSGDESHDSEAVGSMFHGESQEEEASVSLNEGTGELPLDTGLADPPDGNDGDLCGPAPSLQADIDERDAGELLSEADLERDGFHGPVALGPAGDRSGEDAEFSASTARMPAQMGEGEPEALHADDSDAFLDEGDDCGPVEWDGPLSQVAEGMEQDSVEDADGSSALWEEHESDNGYGVPQAGGASFSEALPVESDSGREPSMAPDGNARDRFLEMSAETGGESFSDAVDIQGPVRCEKNYDLPPLSLLNTHEGKTHATDNETLQIKAELLEAKLNDFGVKGEVTGISPGPVITTFEYKPAAGVKISKIVNLTDDLALALSALSIRIVAPIPGRDVVGIEIPNVEREIVSFRDLVDSSEFRRLDTTMGLCLGKDIVGTPVVAELNKMPHLLIAGATGTGKSVGLNAMITSLLYKASPDEVKFIMIDPKRIELSFYNGIPHLISPVVTDMKKATNALFWAVREMERRYDLLAENKVRNVNQYNRKMEMAGGGRKLPFIVIIIDELADLMMTASRDVEVSLARLAQMARAAGIHMILATQRPSVDVLTGTIKANFPTRISFQVSSKIDSRTIIDTNGAETLLGNGDMLFVPPGTARLARIHGAYISEEELIQIIEFVKEQQEPEYNEEVTAASAEAKNADKQEEYDERYDEAVALVTRTRQASISSVQRHLRIGYNRSARIIEMMENNGIVGPPDGSKGRQVLVQSYDEMEEM